MKFSEKLKSLGFETHAEYWQCDHWKSFKKTYYETHKKICFHCHSDRRVTLHHTTYDRLGTELEKDVVPLCWWCHSKAHELIKEGKTYLQEAHLHLDGSLPTRKGKKKQKNNKYKPDKDPLPSLSSKKLSKKQRKKLKKQRRIEERANRTREREQRNREAGGVLCKCLQPTYEMRWNISKNGVYQLGEYCSTCGNFFKWLNKNSIKEMPPKPNVSLQS
jgi:hypothetical protein